MEKVVVCVSLKKESLEQLRKLKKLSALENKKIIFVHCFEVQLYAYDFMASYYPSQEQIPDIEESILEILKNTAYEIISPKNRENIELKFLHSTDPKEQIISFLKEVEADQVIVATRGKHGIPGLFSSSFAEYMVRHSPCDLIILRPEKI